MKINRTKLLLKNTLATYLVSVLGLFVGLFASRWVLMALGATDYGLFGLVGSIIVFITFLNNVMARSVSRHFAYAIGKMRIEGRPEACQKEINVWFNTSLVLHCGLPLLLVLAGYPIGMYMIHHVLVIPETRLPACITVFNLSLASAVFSMASVPFNAMFIAKQNIVEVSLWSLISLFGNLVFAYLLLSYEHDKLIFYATYMTSLQIITSLCIALRANMKFPECAIAVKTAFEVQKLKEIVIFAGFNLLGAFSSMFAMQGSNIVLNLFGGPAVNAAFGIGNRVSAQANMLSSALVKSFTPEITQSEGSGDCDRVRMLAKTTSKLATLLCLLFLVPLFVEADYFLLLWLKTPPPYSAVFSQWMLLILFFDLATLGPAVAINATGRIAAYHTVLGLLNALSVPLVWIFLKLGFSPSSVGGALLVSSLTYMTGRILFARKILGIPVQDYVKSVLLPLILVAGILSGLLIEIKIHMEATVFRLLTIGFINALLLVVGTPLLTTRDERRKLKPLYDKLHSKLHF